MNPLKDDNVVQFLSGMTAFELFAMISSIAIITIFVYKLLEKYHAFRNKAEDEEKELEEYEREIEKLKNKSNDMDIDIKKLNDKMNTMFSMMLEMRKHDDNNRRANLKDRIAQAYRYHSENGKWTEMDKEALEDLIQSYESCGGTNSFVHDIVQKKMYTWEIVDENH